MAKTKTGAENRLAEIEAIRRRLAEVAAERDETERAPLTPEEIATRASAIVDRLVAQADAGTLGKLLLTPRRRGAVNADDAITRRLALGGATSEGGHVMPAGSLLAAMDREAVVGWLADVAARESESYPPALSEDERAQRLDLLDAERLELERDEAAACWTIEEMGLQAPWRADQPVAIVLGLED